MKKIGRYLIILVLLLMGLCCIGLLYLFFIPNASLFGITYIGDSVSKYSPGYSITNEERPITSIVLNSNSYDVEVVDAASEDDISVRVLSKSFGYVLVRNSEVTISSKLFNGVLTFTVNEPSGLMYKNGSIIQLRLPSAMADIGVTLKNNSATTTLKTQSASIKNFGYETNIGDLIMSTGKITGDLALNIRRSSVELSNNVVLNSNNLTLNATSGAFVTGDAVTLGDVTVNSLTSGQVRVRECANFTAELNEAGGIIVLGKSNGDLKIYSTDTKVEIQEQNAGLCDINLTKSGSVKVGTANKYAEISTKNGNITIDKAVASANLKTTLGNINVAQAYQKIFADTTSGNIGISYAEDADSYNTEVEGIKLNRSASVSTESGYVKITGVDNINVKIKNNGMAEADIYMHDVLGENKIEMGKGDLYIETPTNAGVAEADLHKYTLTTQSEKGTVSVNLSQIEYLATGGYNTNIKRVTFVGRPNDDASQTLTEEDLLLPENAAWKNNTLAISSTTGAITMRNPGLY